MRCVVISMILLLPFSVAAPAAAQPRSGSADAGAVTDEADALFNRGKAALTSGKIDQAYQLYLASWRLKQTHDIAGNLAQVELMLGKKRDAAEHIAFALAHFPPTVQSERREGMKKVLDGLRKEIGARTIEVSVPGAEVLVDGVRIGTAPLTGEVFLEPGRRTVEAQLAGYENSILTIDVAKGSTDKLVLELHQNASAGPGPAPAPAPQHWKPGPALLIPASVLAGGSLAAGIGLTLAANGKRADGDALHAKLISAGATCQGSPAGSAASSCQALQQAAASRDALSKGAVASFVLGGVFTAAAVGLGLWATSPKDARRAEPRVSFQPSLGLNEGGLSVVGAW